MSLYTQVRARLMSQPAFQAWPEMQIILDHAQATQPHAWQLPIAAAEALGGTPEQALPGACAIAGAQISIILIDDLLDADPRGEHQRLGAPAVANLAAAFQAAALDALAQSDVNADAKWAAVICLNSMLLTTALGQHRDTRNPTDEAAYWQVVQTKSAPFFRAAFYLGAVLGGATPAIAEQLGCLGSLVGEMIQIHDDVNDTMAVPANPDWTLGRSPLTILFAQRVDHPERACFLELRAQLVQAPDPDALAEAQAILIRCGAVSYGVAHVLSRYERAKTLLATVPLPRPAGLVSLLEEQVAPIWALFESMGLSRPAVMLRCPSAPMLR
jgi:geranylgeranyl pyrophosphate synthase